MKKSETEKELTKFLKKKAKELRSDWNDVPAWVIKAAAEFIDAKNNPEDQVLARLGEVTSSDHEYEDDKAIVEFLRSKKYNPDAMANGYEIEVFKGYKIEITMWEACENWTLGQLAKHVL